MRKALSGLLLVVAVLAACAGIGGPNLIDGYAVGAKITCPPADPGMCGVAVRAAMAALALDKAQVRTSAYAPASPTYTDPAGHVMMATTAGLARAAFGFLTLQSGEQRTVFLWCEDESTYGNGPNAGKVASPPSCEAGQVPAHP